MDFSNNETNEEYAALPADWKNHPEVQQFMAELADIKQQIANFQAEKAEITPKLKALKDDKQAFVDSIQEQLKKFDVDIRALTHTESQITKNLYNLERTSIKHESNLKMIVAGLESHAQMEAVKQEWEFILADQDWLWIKSIFDFQKTGSEFIASGLRRDLFGVALLDQMGLGKTLQATAAINLMQYTEDFEDIIADRVPNLTQPVNGNYPQEWYSVLWVCPNSIKSSTVREIAKWSNDLNVVKLEGDKQQRDTVVRMAHKMGAVLVCSYEQLRQRNGEDLTPALFDLDWPILVMDEAHKFKNPDSGTFMNVERVSKRAGYVVPMTGTPVPNRPGEMWAILHMLTLKGKYQHKFEKYSRFEQDYCNYYGDFQHKAFERLVNNTKDMVLRRRKDEVLEDLPDKIREVRFVTLGAEQRDIYNQMRDKLFLWLDEQEKDFINVTNFLAQLTYLRQIAILPSGVKVKNPDGSETHVECNQSAKLDEAEALILELLENDEKVLVFSNFNTPLKELDERVRKAVANSDEHIDYDSDFIIGGVKDTKRDEISARFVDEHDNMKAVFGNIAAMGVGLNLQGACSHAIFLDLYWNPGVNEQAEDRLHRQGQKNNVTIHIIQAEETVDAFIAKKIEEKAEMQQGLIERDELRQALHDGLI